MKVIHQTQWFSNKLTVFDRITGHVLQDIAIGDAEIVGRVLLVAGSHTTTDDTPTLGNSHPAGRKT